MKFYLDTSVFGGVFDKEFEKPTHELLNFIENRGVKIVYSGILGEELRLAPEHIKARATNILLKAEYIEVITEEMLYLAGMYIKAGALTEKSANDALHIAVATISGATAIISWNFKHMANFIKVQQYNTVNLQEGYRMINIHSPLQIIGN
jgi:predicted nucleic acid-binding protein